MEVVYSTVEEVEILRRVTNQCAKRNKTRYFDDIYTIEFEDGQIPEPSKEELVADSDESEEPQQSTEQEEQ